jgi:hypothetical protein
MDQHIQRRAEERVERRIGFFMHLVTYLVVNLGIFLVWYFVQDRGKGFPWFLIPLGGWGVGVIVHCFGVFVFDRIRERMIDREARRISKRQDGS